MTKEERIERAKALISFSQSEEFKQFIELTKERVKLSMACAYATNDPIEMAKFMGEAKALDKLETLVQDEVRLVKRMIENGGKV